MEKKEFLFEMIGNGAILTDRDDEDMKTCTYHSKGKDSATRRDQKMIHFLGSALLGAIFDANKVGAHDVCKITLEFYNEWEDEIGG